MCHRFFEGSWPQIAQIDYPTLFGERKIGFPAVDNKATFHAPLRYGDVVECRLWISKIGNSSVEWQYRYFNQGGDLVWSASVMTVCVDMDSLAPMSIPEDLRAGLAATTADGEVE
jgi:YbgC/YbaW family acyl-CoA thioester hydrolase